MSRAQDVWSTRGFALVMLLIGSWLVFSLFAVNMEFDDGYATIANSQHFLGITNGYFWQRGPMMAWLLMPAEFLADWLGLHPLNVRPHHVTMVVLHLAYLFAVWRMLSRIFAPRGAVLLAYVAAVPSFLFFSYSPFISHDLFPGAIALAMLVLADAYIEVPSRKKWLALVALGIFVAVLKQTYGLIWAALLVAHTLLQVFTRSGGADGWRKLFLLGLGAAVSGVLTWSVYALVLVDSFGPTPFWMRPWVQISLVVAHVRESGPVDEIIYQGLYFKNLSAYGYLAMALVVPGLALSLKQGTRLQRSCALVWILLVALMQIIQFKEVRYLGYLAPLTAVIIVPAIDALVRMRRSYVYLLLGILLVDFIGIGGEAARIRDPYYRTTVTTFLSPLPLKENLTAPVVLNAPLSFVSPEPYAFYRDRFHRITNLIADQIRFLYGYPASRMLITADESELDAPLLTPGAFVFFVNDIATRGPPFRADNRPGLEDYFVQLLAVAEMVTLEREGEDYLLVEATAQPLILVRAPGSQEPSLTAVNHFQAAAVDRLRGISGEPQQLRLMGFRIKQFCNISGCRAY